MRQHASAVQQTIEATEEKLVTGPSFRGRGRVDSHRDWMPVSIQQEAQAVRLSLTLRARGAILKDAKTLTVSTEGRQNKNDLTHSGENGFEITTDINIHRHQRGTDLPKTLFSWRSRSIRIPCKEKSFGWEWERRVWGVGESLWALDPRTAEEREVEARRRAALFLWKEVETTLLET
ncbi:hypothetical protein RRG08_000135 [Elysia crispata]|uniref:Uncharacterized protein n=1 Tax=Elysia crispata TaxID=231223 RepID=A0AAE1D5J7_9GAST|nr:hypothetical protein RRG08_000135 [Elysia crispata]